METATKSSLADKLVAVLAEVDHVEKRGKNDFHRYNYVMAADIAHPIRKALSDRGIMPIFSGVSRANYIIQSKNDEQMQAVDVAFSLSFRDSETGETLDFGLAFGTGADKGDKAVYKAMTGAMKYALRNAFLVPDQSDPEADESVDRAVSRKSKKNDVPDYAQEEPKEVVVSCQDCGHPVKAITGKNGSRSYQQVLNAGRERYDKDLCAPCQIARAKHQPTNLQPFTLEDFGGEIRVTGYVYDTKAGTSAKGPYIYSVHMKDEQGREKRLTTFSQSMGKTLGGLDLQGKVCTFLVDQKDKDGKTFYNITAWIRVAEKENKDYALGITAEDVREVSA